MSAGDIELRQAKVMVSETNGCPVIRVQGDVYVARGSTPMGVFTYTLTPRKDGDVGLDWNLEWKAVEMKAWEVGVKFKLPGAFNELAWEREGQWSEYPADHVGALEGRVRNGTLSFQSVKRDAYWASLSGSEVYGLALIRADSTLHVRSYFEKGETTFYALSGLGTPPVGDWAKPLWAICDIFLKPDVVRRGSVTLRLVKPMRGE